MLLQVFEWSQKSILDLGKIGQSLSLGTRCMAIHSFRFDKACGRKWELGKSSFNQKLLSTKNMILSVMEIVGFNL